MRDVITLHDMRFHALVGVYPHEYEIAQPIAIDVSAEVDRTDGAVVDYAVLYGKIATLMSAGHIDYLETIAERVASEALAMAGVAVAHVAVRKLNVALPGPLAYAEIRITRPAAR